MFPITYSCLNELCDLFSSVDKSSVEYSEYNYKGVVDFLYRLSSETKEVSLYLILAIVYEKTVPGVAQDLSKAVECYERAAELGSRWAALQVLHLTIRMGDIENIKEFYSKFRVFKNGFTYSELRMLDDLIEQSLFLLYKDTFPQLNIQPSYIKQTREDDPPPYIQQKMNAEENRKKERLCFDYLAIVEIFFPHVDRYSPLGKWLKELFSLLYCRKSLTLEEFKSKIALTPSIIEAQKIQTLLERCGITNITYIDTSGRKVKVSFVSIDDAKKSLPQMENIFGKVNVKNEIFSEYINIKRSDSSILDICNKYLQKNKIMIEKKKSPKDRMQNLCNLLEKCVDSNIESIELASSGVKVIFDSVPFTPRIHVAYLRKMMELFEEIEITEDLMRHLEINKDLMRHAVHIKDANELSVVNICRKYLRENRPLPQPRETMSVLPSIIRGLLT